MPDKLKPTDAIQIMNEVASTVVAGNRKREALMVTNFPDSLFGDPYAELAKQLFGVDTPTPEQRNDAKAVALAKSYGAAAHKLNPLIAPHRKSAGHFGLCDECNGEHNLDGAYLHDDCGGAHDFKGWYCTRAAGHDGPCALYPIEGYFNAETWKPRPLWKVWLGLR